MSGNPAAADDGGLVDGDGCNADCRPSGEVLWSTTHGSMLGLAGEALGCAAGEALRVAHELGWSSWA